MRNIANKDILSDMYITERMKNKIATQLKSGGKQAPPFCQI